MTKAQQARLLAGLRAEFGRHGVEFAVRFSDYRARNVIIWHPVHHPARRVAPGLTKRIQAYLRQNGKGA